MGIFFVRMIFGPNCLAKNCGDSFLQRMHFIDSNTIQLFSPHAQFLKDLDLFNIQHSPMIFHSSIKFQNMLEISPEIKTFLLLGYLLKQKNSPELRTFKEHYSFVKRTRFLKNQLRKSMFMTLLFSAMMYGATTSTDVSLWNGRVKSMLIASL